MQQADSGPQQGQSWASSHAEMMAAPARIQDVCTAARRDMGAAGEQWQRHLQAGGAGMVPIHSCCSIRSSNVVRTAMWDPPTSSGIVDSRRARLMASAVPEPLLLECGDSPACG